MFTKITKTKYTKYAYLLIALIIPVFSFAQVMQSSSYQIELDSVNTAGAFASSANYKIEDSSGELATGNSDSSSYDLDSGYQQASSSSVSVPTPTPAPTPASTGGGGHPGIVGTFEIKDIKITASSESADITWTTSKPATSKLSWGETSEYELGVLSEDSSKTEHAVNIESLSSGKTYFFKIELLDVFGKELNILGQQFATVSLPVVAQAISNATDLKAGIGNNQVILNWGNPKDFNFDSVRVLRSSLFYPSSPNDGDILYEGVNENIYDNVPQTGETYYYTVFAKDTDGNYSSGVIVNVKKPVSVAPTTIDGVLTAVTPTTQKDPFEDLPIAQEVSAYIESLTLLDFEFTQNGESVSFGGETIDIKADENLKISVDYDKLPEVLKTIGVTLKDPKDENKIFSFLLRVNKDKTAYEAVIAPLGNSGRYNMGISIIDFKNQIAKQIDGGLSAGVPHADVSFPNIFKSTSIIGFLLLLLFVFIMIIVRKFGKI